MLKSVKWLLHFASDSCYILNQVVIFRIVPTDFKLANIIPVYKKDSQTCLSNYRPIPLLSIFDKLLERHKKDYLDF